MCIIADSTMYNDDGMRNCSYNNSNTTIKNKNTNIISTTPKHLSVGVGVEVTTESNATNNSLQDLKT